MEDGWSWGAGCGVDGLNDRDDDFGWALGAWEG